MLYLVKSLIEIAVKTPSPKSIISHNLQTNYLRETYTQSNSHSVVLSDFNVKLLSKKKWFNSVLFYSDLRPFKFINAIYFQRMFRLYTLFSLFPAVKSEINIGHVKLETCPGLPSRWLLLLRWRQPNFLLYRTDRLYFLANQNNNTDFIFLFTI